MEKGLMKRFADERYGKWAMILLCGVSFLAAAAGLHDMQTAQGVGLYFAMLAGGAQRKWFDLAVDVLGLGGLFLLLLLPCLALRRRNVFSFWRLFAGYLALLPGVNLAGLVHLFDPPGIFALREAFREGRILWGLLEGIGEFSPFLKTGLPFGCLLLLGRWAGGGATGLKRWQKRLLSVCGILLLCAVLFPAPAPFCAYAAQYLLLLIGFDIWEELWESAPRLQVWGMLLFAGFWLRGIWMILEVMSVY